MLTHLDTNINKLHNFMIPSIPGLSCGLLFSTERKKIVTLEKPSRYHLCQVIKVDITSNKTHQY